MGAPIEERRSRRMTRLYRAAALIAAIVLGLSFLLPGGEPTGGARPASPAGEAGRRTPASPAAATDEGSPLPASRFETNETQGSPRARPSRLSGRCIYVRSAAGVPGATVRAAANPDTKPRAWQTLGKTDASGVFDVPLDPGLYTIRCVTAEASSSERTVLVAPGRRSTVELFLREGAALFGRVEHAGGRPAPGARVMLRPSRGEAQSRSADDRGRFEFRHVPSGPARIAAVSGDAFAESFFRLPIESGEIVLVLRRSPSSLSGCVRDTKGQPLESVEISIEHRGSSAFRDRARTHDDGCYSFPGLVDGQYALLAHAPNDARASASVLVKGKTEFDLVLEEDCGAQLLARMEGPPAQVLFAVAPLGVEDSLRSSHAFSGVTGEVVEAVGVSGFALVRARTIGSVVRTATRSVALCGQERPVVIDLDPEPGLGAIEAIAVDEDGGRVSGIEIWTNFERRRGLTDEVGRVLFDSVRPGAYRVGTRENMLLVEVTASRTSRVEVPVEGMHGPIEGHVLRAKHPAEGALVLAACGPDGRPAPLSEVEVVARTNGAGAFSFEPSGGGLCVVAAEHDSGGRSEAAFVRSADSPVTLELVGDASLSGRVVNEAGRPVTSYLLRIDQRGGPGPTHEQTLRVSESAGRFTVRGLTAGRVRASVESAEGTGQEVLSLLPGEQREGVEIIVGGKVELAGSVVDESDAPVIGAEITVRSGRERVAEGRSGEDGRFTLEAPAGRPMRAFARANGYEPSSTHLLYPTAGRTEDVGALRLRALRDRDAGIGIHFALDARGIRVTAFQAPSAAAEAGVRIGDLIQSIDGVAFGAIPTPMWVAQLGGPEGTPVGLALARATEVLTFVVIRKRGPGPPMPDELLP